MNGSPKSKTRRPIFEKKTQEKENGKSPMYTSSPNFFKPPSQPSPSNFQSQIIYSPRPTASIHQQVRRASTPTRININPPNQWNQQHCYPPPNMNIRYQQSQPLQNNSFENLRRSAVRPTVVAVQRILKPVGQNRGEREIRVLKPDAVVRQSQFKPATVVHPSNNYELKTTNYSPINQRARLPQDLEAPEFVHRKREEMEKIRKLSNMNDILVSSYDCLYEQLQGLKGQISEPTALEEDLFLKKTFCQIQNIFNLETLSTINKMKQVQRISRKSSIPKHLAESIHA